MTNHSSQAAKQTGSNTQVTNLANTMSDDQMVKECTPLIYNSIRSVERQLGFNVSDFFRDDLVQEAWLAICKARPNYNPAKGATFTTYVSKTVFYTIWHAVTDEMEHGATLNYYDEQVEHDEIVEDSWTNVPADSVYEADYGYQSQEAREKCESLLKRVKDETDKEIVRLHHGLVDGFEHSFKSIAFYLGISSERVRQRHDRGMKQLLSAA